MKDYDIATENTYNTDEKGFMLGITARSKRVFTRAIWEQNERRAAIQDGNREWISVIACICGDGSSLPPGIIYEGKAGIQSSWVCDLQPNLQEVFIAHSTSGWINNELGLAWLEQVFNRFTIDKARRRWRLLILDGHGSHVTSDFINFCDAHKILLAVFPPHSTHSLQPLDVVMFAPLASAYSKKLQADLQRGHGTNWDKQRRVFIKLLDYLERKFQAGAYFEEFSSYRRAADGRAGCTKTL
ncbi:DDE 1 domain containing protein [Pyrenophora teres f. teres]|uniref:DDE 1 domain containing protein n=1 Tax=Pyrenophora teres f. teres TaxID=97479 RepID=A0A6S6VV01_9PLEO|nr:DDE 1 domain containing protein [Pyrenophora teres f. teres]